RISVAPTANGRHNEGPIFGNAILLPHLGPRDPGRLPDNVSAVVELGPDGWGEPTSIRDVVHAAFTEHRDAVVHGLERLKDPQFLPLRPDATHIVHDVAQTEDELRRRALGFEGEET